MSRRLGLLKPSAPERLQMIRQTDGARYDRERRCSHSPGREDGAAGRRTGSASPWTRQSASTTPRRSSVCIRVVPMWCEFHRRGHLGGPGKLETLDTRSRALLGEDRLYAAEAREVDVAPSPARIAAREAESGPGPRRASRGWPGRERARPGSRRGSRRSASARRAARPPVEPPARRRERAQPRDRQPARRPERRGRARPPAARRPAPRGAPA